MGKMKKVKQKYKVNATNNKRIPYLDYLRIIACFLVVQVHVSAAYLGLSDINTPPFLISLAYDFIGLIGVPLFVMITGALTLSPKYSISLKSVLINKVLHYFLIYYIWKAFYQCYTLITDGTSITLANIKSNVILALIQKNGYYHLWYLPMIAILFMFYPIIKKSLESNRNLCIYFIIVFFIVEVFFPTLFNYEFKFKYLFVDFFNLNSFSMFGGYLGYFVLGHFLHEWCNKSRKSLNILIIAVALISTIVATYLGVQSSINKGEPSYIMNTPFSVPSFIVATAIFILIKNISKPKQILPINATRVANATLGIYLLHPLVIDLLPDSVFDLSAAFSIILIPLLSLIIAAICFFVTKLILYIPIVKRLVS
jgi:surface polysaccharide O-acyltransferase-like enzyme